jgi:hypothetical protein
LIYLSLVVRRMAAADAAGPYPRRAYLLSLASGILTALAGAALSVYAGVDSSAFVGLGLPTFGVGIVITEGIAGLILGLVIIAGAYRLKSRPESAQRGGLLIMVCSLLSLFGGAGLILGLILGLVGGLEAYLWRPPVPVSIASDGTRPSASIPRPQYPSATSGGGRGPA